jgi:hypothetical protein
MNANYNNHRIKVHQSVIDRLEAGKLQKFKTKKGRPDWYEWEPFDTCFDKITNNKKDTFKFKGEEKCKCIEVVRDSASINRGAKNRVSFVPVNKKPNQQNQENESTLSVAYKMEESFIPCLLRAEALRKSILKKAFEGRLV